MGTDIYGWIEIRDGTQGWRPETELSDLYSDRDYDAFAWLFGLRNIGDFQPLAANRGLPVDVSHYVRGQVEEWQHGTTWISWAEVATADWEVKCRPPEKRVRIYQRRDGGALRPVGWYSWLWEPSDLKGEPLEGSSLARWREHGEWTSPDGSTMYRAETLRRRHAVPPDGPWQPVWQAMAELADRCGDQGVRLVVWFG
ncbi:hypothetical protein [Actinomadura sp. 9N215]|uniref:hypothetical protein n=1 Tax=Actinomadura sp. 9N215 TaxID=3375150 RepID=UPI00379696E2